MTQTNNTQRRTFAFQRGSVNATAEHLVSSVGREAAIRMCRANMWLGVLSEIEQIGSN